MSPTRKPSNVLIIDDDPNIHLFLRRVFNEINANRIIKSFDNGKDAIAHISNDIKKGECIYDIAIIDLMLPEIPGHEINALLKYKCPSTVSIALTNGEERFGLKEKKAFKFDYAVSKGWIFERSNMIPSFLLTREGLYDRSLQDILTELFDNL